MTSRNHFRTFLDGILREGRYRTFIDLERQAARPPHAIWRRGDASREVVIWCSNDYLGIGPPPCGHRCHGRDHASLGDTRAATRNQRGFKIERGAFAAGGVITTGIVYEKGTEYAKNGS
jgi:5-aminolevulinate synthase